MDIITFYDIETILNMPSPPKSLMLAGAAILILLADGTDVPENITWEAFRELVSCYAIHFHSLCPKMR